MGSVVRQAWASDKTTRGDKVRLYREYYDGEHRADLTTEMRKMLRINDNRSDIFNANYCEQVVNTMADRLSVTAISGDNDAASQWSADLMNVNRFDGLQVDVTQAEIRDGDTFVMVSFDNTAKHVRLTHETAWDGESGMMMVYDRSRQYKMAAAKVWFEGEEQRVNIYWPDRVEKLRLSAETVKDPDTGNEMVNQVLREMEMMPGEDRTWTLHGEPIGVPVIHFRNREQSRSEDGASEIAGVVPLQDALNRTMVSMVMTSELTAFGVRVAKGFEPQANLAPGMWVQFGADQDDAAILAAMDAKMMEQGEITPFIEQANFLIDQIGIVSRTPLPNQLGGDNQSGEALKQRESGLLGKISKFQVKTGNSWEDVLGLAARVNDAFAAKNAPVNGRWTCQWKDAQMRNAAEVIANAMTLKEVIGVEEALRLIANQLPEFGWNNEKVIALAASVVNERVNLVAQMAARVAENRGSAVA